MTIETELNDVRGRVLELLRTHGWNATSFQVLERGFAYWFDPSVNACVAYVDTGRAWVAAGSPICATNDLRDVAGRFIAAARVARRRACFVAVEDRFIDANDAVSALPIGEQPSWDPRAWPLVVERDRSLREQLRRARAKKVVVRAISLSATTDAPSTVRGEVERLVQRWLDGRKVAPMGFMVDVQLFDFVDERRYFVADQGGALVGLLAAVPIFQRQGWLFEDLLREPRAPNGTTELLFDFAMRTVAEEGGRFVTLGVAPLSGVVHPWLRLLRDVAAAFYDFDGIRRFKAKLRPSAWSPVHLAWPRDGSANRALLDALAAFTLRPVDRHQRASFVRFGLETLAHAPALGVRLLVACLVPWTVLLALAPTERFFPSRTVQLAWVVWDVALGLALIALARRWRSGLARALAAATTFDAVLTLAEVGFDGMHRVSGLRDALVVVIACAGPLLAASQLWGALAWRARRQPIRSS